MPNYNTIEIAFKGNSICTTWEADKGEWDDYAYDGTMFIIVKDGVRVGFYNVDCIESIIIK